MKCENFANCYNVLLPHEGRDSNPYYHGYCDECCRERREESEAEDREFDLAELIDDYARAWARARDKAADRGAGGGRAGGGVDAGVGVGVSSSAREPREVHQ